MRHVGENIKRIRKAKKMTISDLAGEQISRGMISLIENGKTQPSIERIQYLAEKLNVQVAELLNHYTKSELQLIIQQAISYKETRESEELQALVSPLLNHLDESLEAAQLYKLYGEAGGLKEEWALVKAVELFEKNGLQDEALSCRLSMVRNHLEANSVESAIELLEEQTPVHNDRLGIECLLLKVIAYETLGEIARALDLVEEAIQLARMSLELGLYYELLKMKALLHYGVGDHESARSIINTANLFVQTVQNEKLLAEHGILFIHLEEFYEDNEEIAVELADEYVKYMLLDSPLSPDLKKEYIEIAYHYKARSLVKMEQFSEALEIFKQYPIVPGEHLKHSHIKADIRELSKSYEALCHLKMGNREKALHLAKSVVEKLQVAPHSPYYKFAEKVLGQVQSMHITSNA